MTKEEVIKELQHCIDCYPICEAPCDEALEIAIDSLKKDTRPKGHWNMHMCAANVVLRLKCAEVCHRIEVIICFVSTAVQI